MRLNHYSVVVVSIVRLIELASIQEVDITCE